VLSDLSPSLPFPNGDSSILRILTQPAQFLLPFVERISAPYVLYSRDTGGQFVYLSNSAEAVLDQSLAELRRHSILPYLTNTPHNSKFRVRWSCGSGSDGPSFGHFDIIGREGTVHRIEFSEVDVVHNGAVIGFSGLMRRAEIGDIPTNMPDVLDEDSLLKRVATLSDVERQVVELVVDGNINKKMAKILDVAVRTVESRRARAMAKMQAASLSHLVQMWLQFRRIQSSGLAQGESRPEEEG
jgi:DNA-binding CsgD family transcriptional regulator